MDVAALIISVVALSASAAIGIAQYRLQKQQHDAEQRERASAYVTAHFDPGEDRAFILENVGKAPAIDVRIEMTPEEGKNLPNFNESLDPLAKLDPGASRRIGFTSMLGVSMKVDVVVSWADDRGERHENSLTLGIYG